MNILHTEASPGWGGQELRILREAEGMRKRGHQIILAVQRQGGLVAPARNSGFKVVEIDFRKSKSLSICYQLIALIRKEKIQIVNTHSSLDAWIGGIVGKICSCLVIRTRHLSTPVRKGINSRLLYNSLADVVVTTCQEAALMLRFQAKLPLKRCFSVPTGILPEQIQYIDEEVLAFRKRLGLNRDDCLAGTLCVLRGWKGVSDLLNAADRLKDLPNLKWVIVGSGVSESYFKEQCQALNLEKKVFFIGHLDPPYVALAAMDIFLLLSWANEGVSQANLQAAFLEKPLITTTTGGLKEVCLDQITGIQVPCQDPAAVAAATLTLMRNPDLRQQMGKKAKELVLKKFLLSQTLDQMEQIYQKFDRQL